MTSAQLRNATVSASASIPTYFGMLLRGQLTRGRLVGLGVLGLFAVVLAVVLRSNTEDVQVELFVQYGLGLLLPLSALLLATPMIGNLVEDRLLVYLRLKPTPRWHLAVAALGAVVCVLIPAVLIPMLFMVAILGTWSLLGAVIGAAVVGCLAYGALYLFFGARFSWGLWLALVHLVLFEQIVAPWSDGTAAMSIRSYVNSILAWGTDVEVSLGHQNRAAAILVPVAFAAIATALTALTLSTRDID